MDRLIAVFGEFIVRFRASNRSTKFFRLALLALFIFLVLYALFLKPPTSFPVNQTVRIKSGTTLDAIAEGLWGEGIVKSPLVFKLAVLLSGGSRSLKAGDYVFSAPLSGPAVASRIVSGKFGLAPVKMTVPEGSTLEEIAALGDTLLPLFDKKAFLMFTEGKEGYLFPDTYLFLPNANAETVALAMEDNFRDKMAESFDELKRSGHSIRDIVIMASLLEKEAHRDEDRKRIAGILWKRLDIGMALQVDAAFAYIDGKSTYELTTADLRADSPYNTYTRKGLPAGPIGNPGLDAIASALDPEISPYLYYLSDRKGNVYYSATYEEHLRQKALHVN
ncbi:endolytic transglycosylase MltG [Candidatus Parcubacteria bacterium]|nr:endolytic transglycosylase MltG [Candidatus Parcubacteria bacterium]